MRRLVVLAGLCACNQVFSLQQTQPIDARPVVTSCPAIGITPTYAPLLQLDFQQPCDHYSIDDSQIGQAGCFDGGGSRYPCEGPVGGRLERIADIDNDVTGGYWNAIRFSQDGDEALLQWENDTTTEMRIYHRTSSGWTRGTDLVPPAAMDVTFSNPTRGPDHHVLIFEYGDGFYHELVESPADTWTDTQQIDPNVFVQLDLQGMSLSGDGLRLIVIDQLNATLYEPLYTDRADTSGSKFHAPGPIPGVPDAGDPFLTDDCARIYFSGLGSVFYVEQD